jgi:hypothetical protein
MRPYAGSPCCRRVEQAVADTLFAIVIFVCSIVGHPDIVIAADSSPPALPEHVPFTFTCRRTADDQQSVSGVLDLSERPGNWTPSDDAFTPIAKSWQLRGDWRRDDAQLRVSLRYECQGREDPKRRFCFETRALDKDGKLLAHDWQVEGDNRIGPTEIPAGSITFVRSRLNSTRNRLNGPALRRLARLDFRLTEMPDGMPPHFPAAPHKLNLAVTRPDKCGRFDVTFTNRAGWDLEPAKHEIAFQVIVCDSKGKLIRADRRFLLYREDGRYRERVCVERKYYDYSNVSITIFTRQPDNDKFIHDFFFGGGSGYHGMWTGDSGKLIELPLEGLPTFGDLPELVHD